MKIAIITSTFKPELSGIAETVHKRVRELSRIGGLDILVIGPDYGPCRDVLPDFERWKGPLYEGVRLETYPTVDYRHLQVIKPDGRRIVPFWRWSVDPMLERFQPDLVHVDEPDRLFGLQITDGYGRRIGMSYAHRQMIPIVGMWHTDYIQYAQTHLTPLMARLKTPIGIRLMRWIYNGHDLTLCNSQQALERITGWGVKNAIFLPSVGVDLENFHPRESVFRGQGMQILYVGRITPEKSVGVLLDAFIQLAARHIGVRLRVVGDGPSLAYLRARYLHPRITFLGRIENSQLPDVFAEADIFVNPSHTETFGQTVLEAAACGLPIIAAAAGGNFEAVRAGENGEFFEPGSVDGLEQKLDYLLREPEIRRRYAARSPALAARFENRHVVRGILELWQGLVEVRSRKTQ